MNCSRCGTALPPTSAFCLTCGTLRQPQQLTQVSYQSMPSVPMAASTSTYLPPGTPPWPTTIPQRPSIVATNNSLTPTAEPTPFKPRRSARNTLMAIAVLLLIPLLGAGLTYGVLYVNGQTASRAADTAQVVVPTRDATTPTPQSTDTSTPTAQETPLPTPTSFSQMSTKNQTSLGVFIKYPGGWIEETGQPNQDGTLSVAFHPQQRLGIVIYIARFPLSAATNTSDLNKTIITAVTNGASNVKLIQPSTPQQTIGGSQWDEEDGSFADSNSNTYHIVSNAVKHSQYYYSLFYYSPDVYYNEAIQKYMEPMLNSFKFLS